MGNIVLTQNIPNITQSWNNFLALKNLCSCAEGIVIGLDKTSQYLIQIYWHINEKAVITHTPPFESIKEAFIMYQQRIPWKYSREGRLLGTSYLVGNGDHVFDASLGETLKETMYNWDYKTNSPIFTPRIIGSCISFLDHREKQPFKVEMSVIKKDKNGDCLRNFYNPIMYPGFGTCIMTCTEDRNKEPLVQCQPFTILLSEEKYIIPFINKFWAGLNEKGRMSLIVKYIDIYNHGIMIEIINNPSIIINNDINLPESSLESIKY